MRLLEKCGALAKVAGLKDPSAGKEKKAAASCGGGCNGGCPGCRSWTNLLNN